MFFKKKLPTCSPEMTNGPDEVFTNRKIVSAVEPYIADIQQDIQGLLARHNQLVQEVEGMQVLLNELHTRHIDNLDTIDHISKIHDILKGVNKTLKSKKKKS